MDQIKWLRVIKEELAILEQLAIGMIEDENLTIEEIELAISRSKIVVKEFEMLLNQLPILHPESIVDQQAVMEDSTFELEESSLLDTAREPVQHFDVDLPLDTAREPLQLLEAESYHPPVQQSNSPIVFPSSHPTDQQSNSPIVLPSSSPPVQQSNRPIVPEATHLYYHPAPEEPVAINLDENIEEASKFKPAPLKSLREGLNLNDRYLFQRELFNNDKSKLDATVASLDQLFTIKEAVEYLKANFIWTKSEASEKFIHLIRRRFTE